MLLLETWERYQSDKRIEGISPFTIKTYGFQLSFLKRYFGIGKMANFTNENLKQYLSEASLHLNPSSLGHRVRFVRSFFRWTHGEIFVIKNLPYA